MSHLPGGESRVRVKGCCRSILRGLSCPYWRPSTKGSVPVHSGVASDVAKPSKADMEHMNEEGHKNLAEAIESFLVEKERNHSNDYVNVV